TYAEAGYPADATWKQIRGIFGPKDIPMDIQKKLADGFFKAMQTPAFQKYMKDTAQIDGDLGPDKYPAFIEKMDALGSEWLKKQGLVK
ncbi:MAG: hypothetical protein ACREX1_17815, partial [Advenella sp.]